ncbi:MAG: von Willebrand factor type A domain-containing protein [Pirellulales bacterium]
MSATHENHEPTALDDLHDRLVDHGLTEVVGRETVPNLSARILAASAPVGAASRAAQVAASPAAQAAPRTRPSRAFWASLAVAAMLLVCASVFLLPALNSARFVARSSAKSDQTENDMRQISQTQKDRLGNHSTAEFAEPAASGKLMVGAAVNSDAGLAGQVAASEQKFDQTRSPIQRFRIEAAPGTDVNRYTVQFDQPKDNIGLDGLISDAQAAPATATASTTLSTVISPQPAASQEQAGQTANVSADLNVPFRQGSFANKFYAHDTSGPTDPNSLGDVLREINSPVAARARRQSDEKEVSNWAAWNDHEQMGANLAPRDRRGAPETDTFAANSTSEGTGPGLSGDQYTRIVENPFIKADGGAAVSTFSIDVDTASYANVRQFLMQINTLPPPDAVRIEELVNYFDYDYAGPPTVASAYAGPEIYNYQSAPFAAHVEVAGCPWTPEHRLVRIGIRGREMERTKRPQSNLVFLVDVSGSMNEPAKLPLVVYGLQQLTRELGENDRVAIVVYASSEGLVLPSTRGDKQDEILAALGRLQAGGSTAGGAGIQLAYQLAEDNFIQGGTNRVILCTDGDFNVGVTSTAELQRMVEQKAKDTKVFLSVLGFGRGNLNDAMMEAISNHGNGNYSYVDNRTESRRVLVEEMTGTLVTIAKDVKIQVEFNPAKVAGYRLLGYENRMLRTEDFNDDKKDAGEIGAGHTVTALYEIVPAGKSVAVGPVDDLKYQQPVDEPAVDAAAKRESADITSELLTLKMRYKEPEGDTSRKLEWPITDDDKSFSAATGDFQFAAAVAGFGLLLRDSQYKGNLTYAADLELAQGGMGDDKGGYRAEFVDMVRRAKSLRGE